MRFCRFKFLHEINYVEVGDVTDVIFMSSPSRDSVCSEVTANEDEPERHGKTALSRRLSLSCVRVLPYTGRSLRHSL